MTTSRDPDRLIHAFLREGAEHLQDRVYDAVRADIEHRRQRGRFGPWRMPIMNKLVPIGLGAAAVGVALVVGAQLLGPRAPTGPGGPSSAEPSASPAATVAEPSSTPAAGLPEGLFVWFEPATPPVPPEDGPPITVTIPASGWIHPPQFNILSKGDDADPPEAAMLATSTTAGIYVYGDPCKWASTKPAAPATTVQEVVAAMAAQPSRGDPDPDLTSVGGIPAWTFTLTVPDDAPTRAEAFADCDQATFASFGVEGVDGPWRFHQGPGQVDEFWILDVDGAIVIINAAYRPTTPAALIEEMRTIARSATFEAP